MTTSQVNPEAVRNLADFVAFLGKLRAKVEEPVHPDSVNSSLESFLEAMQSWVEDANLKKELVPPAVDWQFVARLVFMGWCYE